jgi:hypothetical protein
MAERRIEQDSLEYIDCEVPQEMTLREWRCGKPVADDAARGKRLRAAAAAVGRAAKLRRRAG